VMVKLPDGKVLNKILVTDEEQAEDDYCYCNNRIIELKNGNVTFIFRDGTRVTTHMSNAVIITKEVPSQGLELRVSQ